MQGVRISYSGCNDVKDRKEPYGLITARMVAMAKRKERVSMTGRSRAGSSRKRCLRSWASRLEVLLMQRNAAKFMFTTSIEIHIIPTPPPPPEFLKPHIYLSYHHCSHRIFAAGSRTFVS